MSRKNLQIMETRLTVYTRDGYQCQYKEYDDSMYGLYRRCEVKGFDNLQLAHLCRQKQETFIIDFWKFNFNEEITKSQATAILNHPCNLKTSCAKHNSSFNISFNKQAVIELLNKIHEVMK